MFFGDLSDLPIGDVLMTLKERRGTLVVTTSAVTVEIYLDHGAVCHLMVQDRVVTKASLVPKLVAKLLGVKSGEFRFESNNVKDELYRLPLPWLLIEAVGEMKAKVGRRINKPKASRERPVDTDKDGGVASAAQNGRLEMSL